MLSINFAIILHVTDEAVMVSLRCPARDSIAWVLGPWLYRVSSRPVMVYCEYQTRDAWHRVTSRHVMVSRECQPVMVPRDCQACDGIAGVLGLWWYRVSVWPVMVSRKCQASATWYRVSVRPVMHGIAWVPGLRLHRLSSGPVMVSFESQAVMVSCEF